MQLHPVTDGPRKNRYCGPSALSAIAGITTDEGAKLLREVSGRRAIKGVANWMMAKALLELGYDYQPTFITRPKPTLAAWLKNTIRPVGVVYLVIAGNHYQVISGRRYVCGRIREIVSIRDKRVKRRARVSEAWEIMRK